MLRVGLGGTRRQRRRGRRLRLVRRSGVGDRRRPVVVGRRRRVVVEDARGAHAVCRHRHHGRRGEHRARHPASTPSAGSAMHVAEERLRVDVRTARTEGVTQPLIEVVRAVLLARVLARVLVVRRHHDPPVRTRGHGGRARAAWPSPWTPGTSRCRPNNPACVRCLPRTGLRSSGARSPRAASCG